MSAIAFVSACAPRTRAFFSTRVTTSPAPFQTTTPRRKICQVTVTPSASANKSNSNQTPATDFTKPAQDFILSLTGIYAAMHGAPAFAVPEALVEAFKSKPASLAHPTLMWILLGTCLYAFNLGWKSRQIRSAEPERRKELVKKRVTERHFQTTSALFATMTIATFSGMANTYTRTGKLFPGPHLYVGLSLVAVMATMASFVPYMQKGKGWARQAHFSLAFLAISLFGWQAKTGMDIVAKLLEWK